MEKPPLIQKTDLAMQAHAIFERTALSPVDILPISITKVVAKELLEIAKFFEGILTDHDLSDEVKPYLEEFISAAHYYADVLPRHTFAKLEFEGKEQAIYQIATQLCYEIAVFIDGWELPPEWKRHYERQMMQLRRYASDLNRNPEGKVQYV